jgi:GcrA cell cycle regulator
MSWTPERVEALKIMVAEGRGYRQISAKLGLTRSAISGKIDRLGLTKPRAYTPHTPSIQKARSGNRNFNRPYKLTSLSAAAVPEPGDQYTGPLGVMDVFEALKPSQCRWPIGDPREPVFHFCCRQRAPGVQYCPAHAEAAFPEWAKLGGIGTRKKIGSKR